MEEINIKSFDQDLPRKYHPNVYVQPKTEDSEGYYEVMSHIQCEMLKIRKLREICQKALVNLDKYVYYTDKEYSQAEVMNPVNVNNQDIEIMSEMWSNMDKDAPFDEGLIKTETQRRDIRISFFKARNAINSLTYWFWFSDSRFGVYLFKLMKLNNADGYDADKHQSLLTDKVKAFNNTGTLCGPLWYIDAHER